MRRITMRASWLCMAVASTGLFLAEPASAQLFFDWGGQQKVNDTGRMSVRISGDHKPGEIIVSFTDRKLFLITAPGQAISYPIAIPREQDRWEGKTTVTQKRENPSWTPTPTMIKENPRLPRWVPGGHPMNPLGNRALYLGSSFYRIHGTDAPWTIGSAVSKGCIRMYNKDALDLYNQTKVGARVLVTWNSYKFTPVEGQEAVAQAPANAVAAGPASATAASVTTSSATATDAPSTTTRTARSDVGRIYQSGPAEDFSQPRRRRQADEDPDFSQPPRPSSVTTAAAPVEPAPATKAGRADASRRDSAARSRPSGSSASVGSTGQRRSPAAASAPSEGQSAPSSIETSSVTQPDQGPAAPPAAVAATRISEAPAEVEGRVSAPTPAITNRAEREAPSNASVKADKSED